MLSLTNVPLVLTILNHDWGCSDLQHDHALCFHSVTFYDQASSSNNDFFSPSMVTQYFRWPCSFAPNWPVDNGVWKLKQHPEFYLGSTSAFDRWTKIECQWAAGRAYFPIVFFQRSHSWRVGSLLNISHFHLLSSDLKLVLVLQT